MTGDGSHQLAVLEESVERGEPLTPEEVLLTDTLELSAMCKTETTLELGCRLYSQEMERAKLQDDSFIIKAPLLR